MKGLGFGFGLILVPKTLAKTTVPKVAVIQNNVHGLNFLKPYGSYKYLC